MLKEGCSYVRVLGLNNKGAEILKLMKKSSQLNIITNLNKTLKPPSRTGYSIYSSL